MAKGRLTNTEKYAIQGMLGDGKEAAEIAEVLGRTTATVNKYIDGELDRVAHTVAEVQVERHIETDYGPVKRDAKKILKEQSGFTTKQANDLVTKVWTKIRANGGDLPTDARKLARICTQNVSALELTGTQEGPDGNPLAAVMNKAASIKGDEARAAARRQSLPSRTTRGAIFQPKEGKMKFEDE